MKIFFARDGGRGRLKTPELCAVLSYPIRDDVRLHSSMMARAVRYSTDSE